ncbi:tlde1 domain-containing protein [Akkermansia muciniphila]|uniref:tlde1 domain-containing protein n=1 Tax=Akkermansia muciniphila TaxID=239935 RepID=UPI0015E0DAAD|nr:tlde1 domain-containing protein [Akkermansia muciniphila]
MSKHSSCLIHRNFLVGISYSDATPGQSFAYNPYGEPETDCLEANGLSWQVSERYDGLGRQAGYELSADGRRVQQTHLSYDGKGRLSTLTAEGMEEPFSWTYSEQGGLVEQLAYPNGMTRVNTYEDSRDLLSVIDYRRPGSANPPARHEYDYDALGRPTRRRDTWNTAAPKTTRLFTYNSRGELVGDQLRPGGRFGYQYDNIGNRKEAFEFGNTTDYETDELNRYAGIAGNGAAAFVPQYDADGNQTLVKTSTGIWTVTYNAENRPVKFESEDGGTTVECAYDSMGRRFEKKVTVGGTTGFHARYLYRDYLQVAECDLTGETPKLVRSYLWDPSEPEATRVLAMTRWEANGTQVKEHLYCMHDAMKNVTSLFGEARGRRALYEYRPYGGLVTSEGNMAQENKFRFSCEYMDDELGLIYYNYRHLNPRDGRWISRDPIMEQGGWNLFAFVGNKIFNQADILGLICTIEYSIKLHTILIRKVDKDGNILRLTTSRVFSGNGDGKNNPDNVGNKDNGPIPPGKYYVIKRQSGGIRSRIEDWTYKLWNDNDKTQWLAFIAIDDALDDQKEINGVFRSSFRMHYGTRSLGCITFLDKEVFEKAREFILETESRTVKGADGTEYIYYGILEVKKE